MPLLPVRLWPDIAPRSNMSLGSTRMDGAAFICNLERRR